MRLITELRINQPLFSKARPRVTRHGTFMPKAYQDKRKAMLASIKEQYTGDPLEGPLRVEIDIEGEGRADGDNIIGALFDCANGILWTDDRVSIIPELQVRWRKAKKADSLWIIRIYELVE
jgi:Holliday junction resolvase RusA-like endonuclease